MSFLDELNNLTLHDEEAEGKFEYYIKTTATNIQKKSLLDPSVKKEISGYVMRSTIGASSGFDGLGRGDWAREKYNGCYILLPKSMNSDREFFADVKTYDSLKQVQMYEQSFRNILKRLGFTNAIVRSHKIYEGYEKGYRSTVLKKGPNGPVAKYILSVYVTW